MGGPGSGPRPGGGGFRKTPDQEQQELRSNADKFMARGNAAEAYGKAHPGASDAEVDKAARTHEAIKSGGGRGPSDAVSHTNGPAGHETTQTAAHQAPVDVALQRSEYKRQSTAFHKAHPEIEA